MVTFFLYIIFFLVGMLSFMVVKKKKPEKRGNLPPGSMGWPYIGETLQLHSQNPDVFFSTRQKRLIN